MLGLSLGLGIGMQGGGSVAPAWVRRLAGIAADMDVDFVAQQAWLGTAETDIDMLLHCGRSTSAFYPNSDGTLSLVGQNVLRNGDSGLLIEDAKTNKALRTQEFNNASYWTPTNITFVADDIAAPDGTVTADRITASSSNAYIYTVTGVSDISVIPGNTYTYSIYIRLGTIINPLFAIRDVSNSAFIASNISYTALGAVTSGFKRISYSFTAPSGCYEVRLYPIRNCTTPGTMWLWGVQLESNQLTSYMPSTTTAGSRGADVVTFADITWLTGNSDVIRTEHIAKNVNDATVLYIDAASDKVLREQTGMKMRIADAIVTNNVTEGAVAATLVRTEENNFTIQVNDGDTAVDASEAIAGQVAAVRVGLDASSKNALNGFVRRISGWKGIAAIIVGLSVFNGIWDDAQNWDDAQTWSDSA